MKRLNLAVDREQHELIQQEAKRTGRSKNEIARSLIDLGLIAKRRDISDLLRMATTIQPGG